MSPTSRWLSRGLFLVVCLNINACAEAEDSAAHRDADSKTWIVAQPEARVTGELEGNEAAEAASAMPDQIPETEAPARSEATGRLAPVLPAGELRVAAGQDVLGTPLGGLSALAWDPRSERFLALSDDRSREAPARFYTAELEIADGHLDPGDLAWEAWTPLLDLEGETFEKGAIDPEGLALAPEGQLYVASEGSPESKPPSPPSVLVFSREGRQTGSLPIPEAYLPDERGKRGVRDNRGFESLAIAPDGRWLVAGVQGPLAQDPKPKDGGICSARLIAWRLPSSDPAGEWRYPLDMPSQKKKAKDCENAGRLVELLALDGAGSILALERFGTGKAEVTRIYEIGVALTGGEPSTEAVPSSTEPPVLEKRLLVELESLGIETEALEGMTWGRQSTEGRRALVLVGDDDFSKTGFTQWLLLNLRISELEAEQG